MAAVHQHNRQTTLEINVSTEQIQATHAPDGQVVQVKPLLKLICKILQPSTSATDTDEDSEPENFQSLASIMHEISGKISCKCSGGDHADSTTMELLNTLSSYSWAAKCVMTFATFALTHKDYFLGNPNSTDRLVNSITQFTQLPEILKNSETLKNFIETMVNVVSCVVEFNDHPPAYVSLDQPPMSDAFTQIATAVYWTIRSVIVGASKIRDMIVLGHRCNQSTIETSGLISLTKMGNKIKDELQKQVDICYEYIVYQKLVQVFKWTTDNDSKKILEALISNKDGLMPLIKCEDMTEADTDVVKDKHVLLLISDLNMSDEELSILTGMYEDGDRDQYEVVWLPTVDSRLSPRGEENFNRLQSNMTWYSVPHILPGVINYIKDNWEFVKKPILVVLDPQGKVINLNAFHVMCIWGNKAFPFTRKNEIEPWKNKTWSLELFECIIQPYRNLVTEANSEERFIFLYGGEIEWGNEIEAVVRRVEEKANIGFEMIYVGKRYKVDQDAEERNRHSSFWIGLESMWYSMMQNETIIKEDSIKEGIKTMLTFNSNKKGWALISKGSSKFTEVAKKERIVSFFQGYHIDEEFELDNFFTAVRNHLQIKTLSNESHCSHLYLPGTVDGIQKTIQCAECGSIMEKVLMYRCCTK